MVRVCYVGHKSREKKFRDNFLKAQLQQRKKM
jgi:hypothetical protein